jgi:hypothetical protein
MHEHQPVPLFAIMVPITVAYWLACRCCAQLDLRLHLVELKHPYSDETDNPLQAASALERICRPENQCRV